MMHIREAKTHLKQALKSLDIEANIGYNIDTNQNYLIEVMVKSQSRPAILKIQEIINNIPHRVKIVYT